MSGSRPSRRARGQPGQATGRRAQRPAWIEWQLKQAGGERRKSAPPSATGSVEAACGCAAPPSSIAWGVAGDQNGPRRPVLVVDARDPRQERDDLGDLLVGQIQVRHQPPVPLLGVEPRGILQELPQVGVTALLGDLGQVGRVVGALAEQRVAVDAVLAVPHVLARDDRARERLLVRERGELAVTVDRQPEEDQR